MTRESIAEPLAWLDTRQLEPKRDRNRQDHELQSRAPRRSRPGGGLPRRGAVRVHATAVLQRDRVAAGRWEPRPSLDRLTDARAQRRLGLSQDLGGGGRRTGLLYAGRGRRDGLHPISRKAGRRIRRTRRFGLRGSLLGGLACRKGFSGHLRLWRHFRLWNRGQGRRCGLRFRKRGERQSRRNRVRFRRFRGGAGRLAREGTGGRRAFVDGQHACRRGRSGRCRGLARRAPRIARQSAVERLRFRRDSRPAGGPGTGQHDAGDRRDHRERGEPAEKNQPRARAARPLVAFRFPKPAHRSLQTASRGERSRVGTSGCLCRATPRAPEAGGAIRRRPAARARRGARRAASLLASACPGRARRDRARSRGRGRSPASSRRDAGRA